MLFHVLNIFLTVLKLHFQKLLGSGVWDIYNSNLDYRKFKILRSIIVTFFICFLNEIEKGLNFKSFYPM